MQLDSDSLTDQPVCLCFLPSRRGETMELPASGACFFSLFCFFFFICFLFIFFEDNFGKDTFSDLFDPPIQKVRFGEWRNSFYIQLRRCGWSLTLACGVNSYTTSGDTCQCLTLAALSNLWRFLGLTADEKQKLGPKELANFRPLFLTS